MLFVGDAGTTEASRPSSRHGIEWLVQFTPVDRVSFDAGVALTNARFSDHDPAGRFIPGAPERVVSAGLTFERFDGWFGSIRWQYFGPRPLIEDDSVRSKSTSLVNARIGRETTSRTRISLDIYNLYDRRDIDIDYYYESRRAAFLWSIDSSGMPENIGPPHELAPAGHKRPRDDVEDIVRCKPGSVGVHAWDPYW